MKAGVAFCAAVSEAGWPPVSVDWTMERGFVWLTWRPDIPIPVASKAFSLIGVGPPDPDAGMWPLATWSHLRLRETWFECAEFPPHVVDFVEVVG